MPVTPDPLEEKLHLPAALVKFGNGQGVEGKVVGQEDETFVGVGMYKLNASEALRIFRRGVDACENDCLIATESRSFVDRPAFLDAELQVLFRARDEESHARLKAVESGEIDIAPSHGIEGARVEGEMVERFDIVHFAVGNVDKTGNVAAQIDQGVELDGRLASAEVCPRKEGQAKIDGGGIEGIDRLLQIDGEPILSVEFARLGNEDVSEVGIDAPVALLVGFGQSVACDRAAKAQVIKFGADGVQTGFDIAETVTAGELCERHAEELIEAGELPDAIISLVLAHAAVESALGQGVHELREEILSGVHRQAHSTGFRGKGYGILGGDLEIDTAANVS